MCSQQKWIYWLNNLYGIWILRLSTTLSANQRILSTGYVFLQGRSRPVLGRAVVLLRLSRTSGGPVRGDSWPTKWQVIVEKSLKSAKCGKSAGGNLKSWVSRKIWGKYDGSVEKPSKFLKVRWDFLLFYMSKRCFRGTVILGLCIRETCCFAINRPLTDPPKKGVFF